MSEGFRQAAAVKPAPGDLWVAATLVTDKVLRLGLSRLWLLSAELEVKAEIPTGAFGMVSGLAVQPGSGVLWAFDPTARRVTRIGADGAMLPDIALAPGRGLGSGVFMANGDLLCGEHLSGDFPPFQGDGRLYRFDAQGRFIRKYGPEINGGMAGFLGLTHITLMKDGRTLAYVSETGSTVYRYDIAEARQLAPLYVRTDLPGMVFGIAGLPDDDVLVMCGNEMRRIAPDGAVQRTYKLPDGRGWSFVRVTKDGRKAWCGDFFAATLARIDLASGEAEIQRRFDLPFGLTCVAEAA
jgi:hypothetical protein